MDKPAKAPLFSYLVKPHFRLKSPDRLLSEAEFDLARITVEDFRFVTREMTTNVAELPAEIRGRSTILRRLLSERDLFNAGRLLIPSSGLRVLARMLDFDPIHPAVLLTCGNYPWAGDRLPKYRCCVLAKGATSFDWDPLAISGRRRRLPLGISERSRDRGTWNTGAAEGGH
ncbi:hypothetical protein X773_26805 [Mesorhizobium sp. LSJC285A00]|nr:hypothetical protein X773_26805 [Mesorhizobium sp. LSJC285A00]